MYVMSTSRYLFRVSNAALSGVNSSRKPPSSLHLQMHSQRHHQLHSSLHHTVKLTFHPNLTCLWPLLPLVHHNLLLPQRVRATHSDTRQLTPKAERWQQQQPQGLLPTAPALAPQSSQGAHA